MNWDTVREMLPHYAVMFVLIAIVVTVRDLYFPDVGFWVLMAIAILIAFLYPYSLRYFGMAPKQWQR